MIDIRAIREIGRREPKTGRNQDDPTPEEIAAMCAEIRLGWGATTERSRRAPERIVDLGTLHRIVEDETCT